MRSLARRIILGLTLLLGSLILVLVLLPDGELVRQVNLRVYLALLQRGLTGGLTADQWSTILNAAIVVPLAAGLVAGTRLRAWAVVVGLGLVSATVELVQLTPVMNRQGDLWDIVANTLGAVLGALVGLVIRGLLSPDRRAGRT